MASASNRHKTTLAKVHQLPMTAVALQDHIARNTGLVKTRPVAPKPRPSLMNQRSNDNRGNRTEQQINNNSDNTLTLAQRLGLVERPSPSLSEYEWETIMITSSERGDSSQPCPICQDDFRMKPQVLLSCTHTFHKSCLLAFERFSGKKYCPLCRHHMYQTRTIKMASQIYKEKSATKIQAVWRGYVARKWYKAHRELHPPEHPGLRKKYYRHKLTKVTDKMVDSCMERADTLDSFLASIDNNVRQSREIMSQVDSKQDTIEWEAIRQKAMLFLSSPCAVCLTDMTPTLTTDYRPLSCLSCTHLFHTSCISSLELYSVNSQPFLCPICRNVYARSQL